MVESPTPLSRRRRSKPLALDPSDASETADANDSTAHHHQPQQQQELLKNFTKDDVHSVKVLGEGAFGIVDLVVVKQHKQRRLCVRKKLLKAGARNGYNDPAKEIQFYERCSGCPQIVEIWAHVQVRGGGSAPPASPLTHSSCSTHLLPHRYCYCT